ncbi:helix-turn-helix domain-containing protein [Microbulbifer sp. THAF38]|uniref:helix-turn-helix domain-containing protein n=1 Tax=Microbulbifer sp. THAF38 TaxID=2587856 RepID=UPI001268EEDE|nr:helix-turn-helix domain-containing protein [Microbulbifer sp. THAF38]
MEMLASIVKSLRLDAGRGTTATARALGMSLSSYKRLERCEYLANGADLQKLGRLYGLDANLLVYGVSLVGEPLSGEEKLARTWQRILYRLRALDLQTQGAVGELVADLYRLHRKRGGVPAEIALAKDQRHLQELLKSQ